MTATAAIRRLWPFSRQAKPQPPRILGGYTSPGVMQRNRKKLIVAAFLFILIYSMAFHLIGRFLIVQFMMPFAFIALLVIWALPDGSAVPATALRRLLFAFLFAMLFWPDYLAIAIGALPWITMLRLTSVPLALIMLVGLSTSPALRAEIKAVLSATPWLWKLVVAFAAIAFLSIALSPNLATSVNKFVIAMLYWVLIFFVAAYVFARPGMATRFAYLLWVAVVILCLIAALEWRQQMIPWAPYIPSFLKIEDESVQRILASGSRAATGLYRVQAKFSTPLGFAEFLALGAPFVLHIAMTARQWWVRLLAWPTFPFIFWTIINTDSRLGAVGFFMTFLLYMLVWGSLRWYRNRDSLFGPAITLAYPIIFASFIAATFAIGRLRAMVWGTGAQSFSTQAREDQFAMAIPKLFSQPWGHGIGQGAEALGYTNLAGELTIDSYYIAIAMEYGVIGFFVFYGMLAMGVFYAGKTMLVARGRDTMMMAPLAIALANFFIIKSVFSQQEGNPLVFAMLGMVAALVWRVRQGDADDHSMSSSIVPTGEPPAGAVRN
jgi:hypothetical protein